MRCWSRFVWVTLLAALGCGGRAEVDSTVVASTTVSGASGSASSGSASSGSASGGGGAGMSASGGSELGGAPSAGGEGGDGVHSGAPCDTSRDCLAPAEPCLYAACVDGACTIAQVASGTFVSRDDPPDCFALVCDGAGQAMRVVDQGNWPAAPSQCGLEVCAFDGTVVTTNQDRGASCSELGGTLCDGQGHCVGCLTQANCATGEDCIANACVSKRGCSDGLRDGDETDIDCGGSCSPCNATRDCLVDGDCASQACDTFTPHRCLFDHCNDHHQDLGETDIDCGGPCAPCGTSRRCAVNADCTSGYCDPLRDMRCLDASCVNGTKDNNETDLDCGGGNCDGCALGEKCMNTWDCASQACDGVSLTCISDHCLDSRFDADETDTDCGGPTCKARCGLGVRCQVSSDCGPMLICPAGNPHICLPP